MWTKIKSFFGHSETIFLARAQVLGGAALEVIKNTDPQVLGVLVGVSWLPVVLIGHGILLEYLRRRGATDLNQGQK